MLSVDSVWLIVLETDILNFSHDVRIYFGRVIPVFKIKLVNSVIILFNIFSCHFL